MKTVKVENILLPKDGVDFEKWAVVACDQFTSQPEYWEKLAAYVGAAPSTLNLIFPEVYLSDNRENRIKKINENMYKYLDENVFKEIKDSFVLVERDTPYEKGRLGLMMASTLKNTTTHRLRPWQSARRKARFLNVFRPASRFVGTPRWNSRILCY